MGDPATVLAVIIGFTFLIVVAFWLGAGTTLSFQGLFARQAARDWPRGVQEPDAPRFVVAHLDGLRPGTPIRVAVGGVEVEDDLRPEIVELAPLRSSRPR